MTKRAKQQQRTGAPVVQRDRCDRWLYLDEAGFPDLATASAANPFTCKPCLTVEALHTRLHALEVIVAALGQQVTARGQEVPDRSEQEQDTTLSTSTPETGAMRTPTSGSSGQPETQPLDKKSAPVNSDDSAHNDHNEPCRQEQDRAPPERPRIHTNMKEAVDRSTGESLQELGTTPNSPGETRRILLVGDGNVPRVARALQRQLGPKQNLQTCWTQHATVKGAQELLHQCIGEPQGEAGRCRRLVVLLVEATDAIRGTSPEDVVQVIRDSVALYAERLVICSVPEVTTRGKVTLARAVTFNAQLRKMCFILRATFLDNSKQL
ncbi:hypothetical protein MRX96_000090 [Rhipicephalus microplus]